MLCFGSESGEISALRELAEILVEEPEEYKKLLKSFFERWVKDEKRRVLFSL